MTLERSGLLNVLQVRPAEVGRTRTLAALMTLTCMGGAISSPGVEALFYARFGVEFLPYMYMALGLVSALTSLVITGLLGRLPQQTLHRGFPLTMAAVFMGARASLATEQAWLYPALWLLVYLTWSLQFFMIWGLAGSVFDTRQAKRLFPLLGAGGILGTAAGSLLTKPLVAVVGAENLLLAWPLAFAIGFVLVRRLRIAARYAPSRRARQSLTQDLLRGYRQIGRSPLLRWMSWSALLLGLLLFAVMFPFSKAVVQNFRDENQMAGFLGVFVGLSTVSAFVTSLLLTNRLFGRLGFMGGLLGFPLIYLVGFAALAVRPAFVMIAGLRFLQLVWRLGVADTAFQAVFNVVSSSQREPVRAFIDGLPRQAGVILAGVLLLLSERTLEPVHTYLLGVVASGICLIVLWRARGAYRTALAQALRAGRPQVFFPEEEPFGGFRGDASAVATAVQGVSDPDPVVRRVAAEVLGNLRLPETTHALVAALNDPDPGVRGALLRALAKAQATSAILEVARHLQDPEPEVRLRAVESLRDLAGFPRGLRRLLEPLLKDPSPQVRSYTAIVMLKTGEHAGAQAVLSTMQEAADPQTRVVALEALASWSSPTSLELGSNGLRDPYPAVRRAAAAAVAGSGMHQGIALLVGALADEELPVREAAAAGLTAYGSPAVEPVLSTLQSPASESGALLALRSLPIGEHVDQLGHYAEERRSQAVRYLDLWDGLRSAPKMDERMELLCNSVRDAAERQARLAIEAMGILNDLPSALLGLDNLQSGDREQRANALEIIEDLGARGFTTPLLRIWGDSAADGEPKLEPLTYLEQTLHDVDAWIRACGVLVAVRHPGLAPRLKEMVNFDPDAFVRQTAELAINGGPEMESLPTISIMERILLLRRVPLFADLPPAELKQIAAIASELVFESEDVIVEQGEPGDEMYIIAQGQVQVVKKSGAGAAKQLARRGPGEYVGEMSIISHEPRMASLVAEGEVRMLCIGQKEFEGIIRERPETSLAVMRELIARLRGSETGKTGGSVEF